MKNYLFYDIESGEDFIVEAPDEKEAFTIAMTYFETPVLSEEITDFEAEMLGLDTY